MNIPGLRSPSGWTRRQTRPTHTTGRRWPSSWTLRPCPRARRKRTPYPPDRKIRDFAEIISPFLVTPVPLIHQNLRFRRNFVKHFSIPWNSDKFSSKSARKHVKLIRNSQKMMKFGGKNCKNTNEKLTNIWVWSGAKEWESCRSRKMWKNAPTLAIVGTHTAENEPSKVLAEMGGPL